MNTREAYLQVEQQIERVKNYNLYVLGPSGAGKTTYIPFLYRQLTFPPPHLGFFLSVHDRGKAQKLRDAHKEIADLRKWHEATDFETILTWEFLCCVPTGNGLRDFDEVLQFTYLDYAGGRVFQFPDRGELQSRIQREADVLLGLLDGWRILKLMHGNQDDFFAEELWQMLELMQSARKPVYFLITKWDILCRQFSLAQVRDYLLSIPVFGRFMEWQYSYKVTTRLIPISAVGMNFTEPQSNTIRQDPGIEPNPINIEIPLLCVLADILRAQMGQLDQTLIEFKNPSAIPTIVQVVSVLLNIVTSSITQMTIYTILPLLGVYSLAARLYPLAEVAKKSVDEYNEKNKKSPEVKGQKKVWRKRIREKRRIIQLLARKFLSLTREYDKEFPDSLLYRKKKSFFIWEN